MRTLARGYGLGTFLVAIFALGCDSSVEPGDGTASAIVLESGEAQGAVVGSPLAQPVVVKVIDPQGDPVSDVEVNFAITSGGGSITGGTARTDEDGLATLGSWTLGSVGENHLTASAGDAELVISAVGRCDFGSSLTLNTVASGILSSGDCTFANGELTDRYLLTLATQRAVRFTQTSSAVNPFLELQGPGNLIAFHGTASVTDDATFRALLPAGTYDVNPSSYAAGQVGSYTISAAAIPENESGCDFLFTVPGIQTDQAVSNEDCVSGTFRYDAVAIYLHAGRTYTFTMTSLGFDTYLELLEFGSERLVAENDNSSGSTTSSRITFVPGSSNFYLLVLSPKVASGRGAYTLAITGSQ